MIDNFFSRIVVKFKSAYTAVASYFTFLENDASDQMEARLQNIEREIVDMNLRMRARPLDQKPTQ